MKENAYYSAILSNRLGKNYFIRDLCKIEYNNYLSLYEKEDIHGEIEIETSDSFASYYVTNNEGDILYCKSVAPYTYLELNIANDETLFLYQNNSIKIKNKKYTLNDFSKDYPILCIFLVFILPFFMASLLEIFLIKNKISLVLYIIYFISILILTNKKNRHIRKLEKKRNEFLNAYFKGKDANK